MTSNSRRPDMIDECGDNPNGFEQKVCGRRVTDCADCAECDPTSACEMISRGLKLISDPMSRAFFHEQTSLVEYLIRNMTGDETIVIEEMRQQVIVTNPNGRSAQFDIVARDENGKIYNIEFQSRREKAVVQRALTYASTLFLNALKPGMSYEGSPEVCVIFLLEHGEECDGRLIRHIKLRDVDSAIGVEINSPIEFYFVSGALHDKSKVGIIMEDLCCTNLHELSDPKFIDRMNALIHQEIGRKTMCEAQEKWENELLDRGMKLGRAEVTRDIVQSMIRQNLDDSIISCTTGMPLTSIQAMRNEMAATAP